MNRRPSLGEVATVVGSVGILLLLVAGVTRLDPNVQTGIGDVLRTASIPAAVVVAAISLRVAVDRTYRTLSQLCRFLGLSLTMLGLAFAEYNALGRPPHWTTLLLLAGGLVLSLLGTVPLASKRYRSDSLKRTDDDTRPLHPHSHRDAPPRSDF